jgi:hypothetical protein
MRHAMPHAPIHDTPSRVDVGVLRFGGCGDGAELASFADAFALFIDRVAVLGGVPATAQLTVAERVGADAFRLVASGAIARGPVGRRVKTLLAALAWARGRAMDRCLLGERWPMLGVRTPVVLNQAVAALVEDAATRVLLEDAVVRPLLTSRATSVSLHAETGTRAFWSATARNAAHYAAGALREPIGDFAWQRLHGRLQLLEGVRATWAYLGQRHEVVIEPRVLRLLTLLGIDLAVPREVRAVIGHTRFRTVQGHVGDCRTVAEIDLRPYMLGRTR